MVVLIAVTQEVVAQAVVLVEAMDVLLVLMVALNNLAVHQVGMVTQEVHQLEATAVTAVVEPAELVVHITPQQAMVAQAV
jgi:hypothetical protein